MSNVPADTNGNRSNKVWSERQVGFLSDDQNRPVVRVRNSCFDWGTLSVTTSSTGENWVALDDKPCGDVTLVNNSGTAISVRRAGESGNGITVKDDFSIVLPLKENANEVEVKRADNSDSTVLVQFLYYL